MTSCRTAYLAFHLNEHETIVFATVDSETPTAHRVTLGRAEIADAARSFHRLFDLSRVNLRRPERTIDLASASALMARLIDPVREIIARADTLLITGHRDLHFFPLHLFGPTEQPPLAMTHSIGYVPNLTLFQSLRRPLSKPLDKVRCLAVAGIDDGDDVRSIFALAPRRFTELSGGELLLESDATYAQLVGASKSGTVLLPFLPWRF